MQENRQPVRWISVHGRRIPIFKGSKEEIKNSNKNLIGSMLIGTGLGAVMGGLTTHLTQRTLPLIVGPSAGLLIGATKAGRENAEEQRRREDLEIMDFLKSHKALNPRPISVKDKDNKLHNFLQGHDKLNPIPQSVKNSEGAVEMNDSAVQWITVRGRRIPVKSQSATFKPHNDNYGTAGGIGGALGGLWAGHGMNLPARGAVAIAGTLGGYLAGRSIKKTYPIEKPWKNQAEHEAWIQAKDKQFAKEDPKIAKYVKSRDYLAEHKKLNPNPQSVKNSEGAIEMNDAAVQWITVNGHRIPIKKKEMDSARRKGRVIGALGGIWGGGMVGSNLGLAAGNLINKAAKVPNMEDIMNQAAMAKSSEILPSAFEKSLGKKVPMMLVPLAAGALLGTAGNIAGGIAGYHKGGEIGERMYKKDAAKKAGVKTSENNNDGGNTMIVEIQGEKYELTEDEAREVILAEVQEAQENLTEDMIRELSDADVQEGFEAIGLSFDEECDKAVELQEKNAAPGEVRWITIRGRRIPIGGKKEGWSTGAKIGAGLGALGAGLGAAYAIKKGKLGGLGSMAKTLGKRMQGRFVPGLKMDQMADKARNFIGKAKKGLGDAAAHGEFMGKYAASKAKGTAREIGSATKVKAGRILEGAKEAGKNMKAAGSAFVGNPARKVIGTIEDKFKKGGVKYPHLSEEEMVHISQIALSDLFGEDQINDAVLVVLHELAPDVDFSLAEAWEYVTIPCSEDGEIEGVYFGEDGVDADGLRAVGLAMCLDESADPSIFKFAETCQDVKPEAGEPKHKKVVKNKSAEEIDLCDKGKKLGEAEDAPDQVALREKKIAERLAAKGLR